MKTLIATFVLLVPSIAVAQEGEIKVAVKRVFESRAKNLIQDKRRSSARNSMGVVLRFSGKPIESATRLGQLQISSVKDDSGNTLRGAYALSAPSSRLTKLRRPRPFGKQPAPPRSQTDLTINMTAPARTAKKIARIQGQITFRISKTTSVLIPVSQLNGLSGKAIENANLKKLGLTANVERFSSKGSSTSLRMKITGAGSSKFLEARFVDGNDKLLDTTSISFSSIRGVSSTTSAYKALPADAQLKIVVETEYKDRTVKIDLSDVPLP